MQLTNDLFTLRSREVIELFESPPEGDAKTIAVMARSVEFPAGPSNPLDHRGLPVERAAILACQKVVGAWQWMTLSPATKEVIGDFMFDVAKVKLDQWYYLKITPASHT